MPRKKTSESIEPNKDTSDIYHTGEEFWCDTVLNYGIDEAAGICGRYLEMNVKREHSDSERQFCRELFFAMYEATAGRTAPDKLVYPYSFDEANKRLETSFFHKSRALNQQCASAIDEVINSSCYKTNHYNLETAAMKAVLDYGFSRVNRVLAFNIQRHESDGRLSYANKQWAKAFTLPGEAFDSSWLRSHLILVEGFCVYVRKFQDDLNAEWLELPGKAESGNHNTGFEITRAIMTDKNQGYVIAHNPNAVSPYVCWQFFIREDERVYNWGNYYNDEQAAVDNYIARVFVALNGG